MPAHALGRPVRALARDSLRIYPVFRRLTKVQAAILLALILGEAVAFGAMLDPAGRDLAASARAPSVIAAGAVGAGRGAPAEGARPRPVLFTSYAAAGGAIPAAAVDQAVLVEETAATGEAAR